MKKILSLLGLAVILFIVSTSTMNAINDTVNSFFTFNIFNLLLIIGAFIFVSISYSKEGHKKTVYEGTSTMNYKEFDNIQRGNYKKCSHCNTQNSQARETCYCCKGRL